MGDIFDKKIVPVRFYHISLYVCFLSFFLNSEEGSIELAKRGDIFFTNYSLLVIISRQECVFNSSSKSSRDYVLHCCSLLDNSLVLSGVIVTGGQANLVLHFYPYCTITLYSSMYGYHI